MNGLDKQKTSFSASVKILLTLLVFQIAINIFLLSISVHFLVLIFLNIVAFAGVRSRKSYGGGLTILLAIIDLVLIVGQSNKPTDKEFVLIFFFYLLVILFGLIDIMVIEYAKLSTGEVLTSNYQNNQTIEFSPIHCTGCGKKAASRSKYCENCGKHLF